MHAERGKRLTSKEAQSSTTGKKGHQTLTCTCFPKLSVDREMCVEV